MNITCAVTDGMNPEEKEIYFAHMEKRHKEESEFMDAERQRIKAYKQSLIESILKYNGDRYTADELRSKSVRMLEIINCY